MCVLTKSKWALLRCDSKAHFSHKWIRMVGKRGMFCHSYNVSVKNCDSRALFSPYSLKDWQFHLGSKRCGIATGKWIQKVIKGNNLLLRCQTIRYHSVSVQLFTLKFRNSKGKNLLNIYVVMHQQQKGKRVRERLVIVTIFFFNSENNNCTLFVFSKQHRAALQAYLMHFEKKLYSKPVHLKTQKHLYLYCGENCSVVSSITEV